MFMEIIKLIGLILLCMSPLIGMVWGFIKILDEAYKNEIKRGEF